MIRYFSLLLMLFILCSCPKEEEPDPFIGTYQAAGTYVDNRVFNYIFNTTVTVNSEGDYYSIEIGDDPIAATPKLNVTISEVKDGLYYFNIMENPYCTETPSNGIDDYNCFDLGEDPDLDPEINLHIAISGLDPDNPYSLWLNAWKLKP